VEPVSLRVIAGFARAHWLSREAYAPPPADIAAREEAIVAALNAAHAEALRARYGGETVKANEVGIVGIDCDGFDVRTNGTILRFDFDDCLPGADEARAAVAAAIRSADTR
jgi:hypothetical protein